MCKSFPIDQRDIDEVALCGGTCGYRFEKHPIDYSPSLSIQANFSKHIEKLPDETSGYLFQ
jgi:hypothetical protein